MGKLKSFLTAFDNDKDVYQCGEVVSGRLIVELSDGMKARGVRLKFRGTAFVYWTETDTEGIGENQRTVTKTYTAVETYFDEILTLWGKERGDRSGENPTLPPGYHEFPFQYQLGTALPSSFEGEYGYVRYYIKGYIDRPWRFDHNTKCAFTVLDLIDLNEEPSALMPAGDQRSKTLCCLCCKSGPIELQVHVDRVGYCPGESVVVRGSVENNSNTRISNISAAIVLFVKFKSLTKTKASMNTVSYAVVPGCERHQSEDFGELVLPIPVTPPSGLRYCDIIEIKYYVEVTAHIDGLHGNLSANAIQLTIGSIPLRSLYRHASQPGVGLNVLVPGDPGARAPPAPYLSPSPIYAEVAGGGVSIKDSDDTEYTMGQLTFTPKYMYYDWSQHRIRQQEHN